MTPTRLAALIEQLFAARRPSFASERELQLQIGPVIRAVVVGPDDSGPIVTAEHRLDARSRLDFYVREPLADAGIGVEIKIKGSLTEVTRQLFRYAEHPAIHGLVLVTTKYTHRDVPEVLLGKPVRVLCLGDYLL